MEKFIQYKGAKIHYTDQPVHNASGHKGRCIVFLHGFLESLEIWEDYAKSLSESYRIVCIDLPGHGKSENIGYVHEMGLMSDCVKEVLRFLQITKCVMIGHSMGGYVTLAFAEKYEQNLKGFALFHSHAAPDPEEKKKDRDKAIQVVKRNPVILINELVPNLFATENRDKYRKEIEKIKNIAAAMTRRGIVNCLEGMKDRADKREILKKTKVPVLLILGKKDPVMNYDALKPQSQLSEQIQFLAVENAGHMGFYEAREECFLAIKKFIRKCHLPLEDGED